MIEDAKKTRDDKIAYVIRLRDESGTLNKEEANARLRKRIVNMKAPFHSADKHREIVSEAKSQAGEHANQVDWETVR